MNTETPTQGPMLAPSKPSEPRDLTRFDKLMDGLREWRSADHEDAIALHRHQVIEIIEGVKAASARRRDCLLTDRYLRANGGLVNPKSSYYFITGAMKNVSIEHRTV